MRLVSFGFAVFLCAFASCASLRQQPPNDYEAVYETPASNSVTASAAHRMAVRAFEKGEIEKAENHAKKALSIDNNFGPAHNTLGSIYFEKKNYYGAAWEFEYAKRLLPDNPNPINNLGLVYESVLRWDEAIEQFQQASVIEPTNSEFLGNLIRTRIKRGEDPGMLADSLRTLITIENRPTWAEWARRQLALKQDRTFCESIVTEQPFGDPLPPAAGQEIPGSQTTEEIPIELPKVREIENNRPKSLDKPTDNNQETLPSPNGTSLKFGG